MPGILLVLLEEQHCNSTSSYLSQLYQVIDKEKEKSTWYDRVESTQSCARVADDIPLLF